jgi:putative endonuclease
MSDWFVYMVQCSDGTLYTGCTNNLESRLEAHNSHNGAKYTRGRMPVKLIYQELCQNRSQAQQREHQIKQLNRQQKLNLIRHYKFV